MKRPLALPLLILITTLTSCGGLGPETEIAGCTNENSFNYNPEAERDDGSCIEMYGCVGFAGGMYQSGTKMTTVNNAQFDQKMNEEVAIQRQFFGGIPAMVYILNEPGPAHKNAYATSNGEILFGFHMFWYTVNTYGELPVAGVLAHEWGHRCMFHLGWNDYQSTSHKELEADAFSGFYMALAKQWAWNQIQGYFANVYATGDYNFHHPSHHGTPQQRLDAAYFGVQTAVNAMQNGIQYSYQELHELFLGEIENRIAGKKERNYEEIEYPSGMSKAYVESLYPTVE